MNATKTKITDRPILFSGEMVRAILDGRKTQTRRVVKPQPEKWIDAFGPSLSPTSWLPSGVYIRDEGGFLGRGPLRVRMNGSPVKCPFGKVGDRLWVRETWCVVGDAAMDYPSVMYLEPRETRNLRLWESQWQFEDSYDTFACWPEELKEAFRQSQKGWRPSMHMPRWASRLTLEITGIRVERLWEMNGKSVAAEGFPFSSDIDQFKLLWDKLYANQRYSWSENPWVWVVEFKPFGVVTETTENRSIHSKTRL